jgi:hypothetical protein
MYRPIVSQHFDSRPWRRCFVVGVVVVALLSLASFQSSAQAFLPKKGEGSVAITYQDVHVAGHFLEDGSRLPVYQSRANNMILGLEYGLADRLALDASLPYMLTKYTGKEVPLNLPLNVLDDGAYHGTFQDFQFGLRYNIQRRHFAVTPFLTVVLPSHAYRTVGEAAAGANLRQLITGAYTGRLLNPIVPRTYIQGMYSYAVVEKAANIPLNRSNTELTAGYFITPSLSANFLWRGQWTHGGLSFSDILQGSSSEVVRQLDRVTRQNFYHVGGGAGLSLTESVSTHFTFVKFVSGQNAHYGEGIFAGISWRFTAN